MSLHTAWLLACLRRYLVPVLLMVYLAGKLLAALVAGDAPQPQIPPDGYVNHTPEVRVSWHGSRGRSSYRIQLVRDDGDFDEPLVDRVVRSRGHTFRDLEPDTGYRWRVIQEGDGRTSQVVSFRTARHLAAY